MQLISKTKSVVSAIKFNLKVQSLPDRIYLRQVMLPEMASTKPANVLLAGTRRYTRRYPQCFDQTVTTVWTIDFDPSAARFGNAARHRVGDMCSVDEVFHDIRFDIIHINGILGFGVDTPESIRRMIEACHRAIQPDGYIMLGWDADRTPDPTLNPDITSRFVHTAFAGLPPRHTVTGLDGYDHVFDWFRRTD
ncbi:hypothetical protein FHS27_004970 [Rhodopirellula rubra]|uniref:Methyltransferase type 11 domain-containing protein n=1 Tax=Aporhodopirellula rubra TaxID=980271 RepID=A0A7W5E4E0_9BACT|nr:class I SAM-dependent methyltransferase [Aporhodopirellula rubra]MBB3209132.1 hypothetical protein [Aporhodopirellula rubra]